MLQRALRYAGGLQASLLDGEDTNDEKEKEGEMAKLLGAGEGGDKWGAGSVGTSEAESYRQQIQRFLITQREAMMGEEAMAVKTLQRRVQWALVLLLALATAGFVLTDFFLFNDIARNNIGLIDGESLCGELRVSRLAQGPCEGVCGDDAPRAASGVRAQGEMGCGCVNAEMGQRDVCVDARAMFRRGPVMCARTRAGELHLEECGDGTQERQHASVRVLMLGSRACGSDWSVPSVQHQLLLPAAHRLDRRRDQQHRTVRHRHGQCTHPDLLLKCGRLVRCLCSHVGNLCPGPGA